MQSVFFLQGRDDETGDGTDDVCDKLYRAYKYKWLQTTRSMAKCPYAASFKSPILLNHEPSTSTSSTKRTGRLRVAEELARVVAPGHVPLNQKMCGKEGPPGPRFRAKASPAGAEFTNGVMN